MFWLVETQDQLDELKYHVSQEIFVQPIYPHPDIHPGIYSPISVYIKHIRTKKGYLINFSHPEALSFDILQVKDYLHTFTNIYTPDKKALNYFCFGINSYDLNLVSKPIENKYTNAHTFYLQRYPEIQDINKIIPIVKHYELCEELYEHYSGVISKYTPNSYHNDITDVFWFIERNALKVNTAFERYFELKRPFLSQYKQYIFTQYNLNTTTGRPSNTFNTINFAALNKDNGCRSIFIPRNDFLLEVDITAYHPTLIAQLVGYESPTGDIYQDFADEFSMTRDQAKPLVFQQLYGHIYNQFRNFKFFRLSSAFIDQVWQEFLDKGYVEGFQSKQRFHRRNIEDPNPQKLFNYLLQNYETSNNVEILKEIIEILYKTETKLILYTYDAFLFDFSKSEKQVLHHILNIFENKKLNVKVSYGTNYDSLQTL